MATVEYAALAVLVSVALVVEDLLPGRLTNRQPATSLVPATSSHSTVSAKTADYTATAADNGTTFTNAGAAGAVTGGGSLLSMLSVCMASSGHGPTRRAGRKLSDQLT